MKRIYLSLFSFLALLVCMSVSGQAQTRDKYLISAKAGGVNFVSGNVTVVRKGKTRQQTLMDQDDLENGDVVTTGMGGRTEVLLNPGSYMRVAENSEFEMTDTALDHLRVKLLRGSAIIEVVGMDDTQLSLQIDTPQTYAVIVKRGIYRINVLPSGQTEVLVRKGRALVGQTAVVVKGDKMLVVGGGLPSVVAKIDKRAKDSLELWSRERAEYLASINRRLPSGPVYAAMDIFNASWSPSYRNTTHITGGVWVREGNCFVFVPVAGRGWSSPYGFAYPFGYRYCCDNNNRDYRYGNTGNTQPVAGGGNTGNTGGSGSGNSGGSGGGSDRGGNYNPGTPDRTPSNPAPVSQPRPEPATYSPPSYSPPPSAPPAPVRDSSPARTEAPMTQQNNPN